MKTTLMVKGMHCQNCVSAVTKALEAIVGVSEVQVLLEDGLVQVIYEGTEKSVEAMLEAIDDIGFEGERA